MTSKIQTLRSSVKGRRPAANTREPGELYINMSDHQIGYINAAKDPQDLVGVRLFSAAADYAIGDVVFHTGQLYRANKAITAKAFDTADWDPIRANAIVSDPAAGVSQTITVADKADNALILKEATGQTGDLLQAQRADGTVITQVEATGLIKSLGRYMPLTFDKLTLNVAPGGTANPVDPEPTTKS